MHTPGRGDGALRRHRASLPATSYFLTLCSKGRAPMLIEESVATAIRSEISAIEADEHWVQRAGVLMPDHLHLLVQLTGELTVSRCIARLKAKTRSVLHTHKVSWQANFYEHRLRPDDLVEDVIRYIFLNPYRGGLVSLDATYRWCWLGAEEASWFKPITNDGRPFPEWLR